MTGMDILRRCRAYPTDMARLRLRLGCARDAAMRITRAPQADGHGSGGGDKMGEYAARIDAIEREMTERTRQYARDVALAAQLVARIDPVQGQVMHLRLVQGMTVRQTAAQIHTSESSVKGLYRRGRAALEAIDAGEADA